MAEAKHAEGGNPMEKAAETARDTVRDIGNLGNRGGDKHRDQGSAAEQLSERLPEAVRAAQEKVAGTVGQVASAASERAGQAAEWLREKTDGAFDGSDVALTRAREYVRQYPMRTLVAGLAIGAVAGWFLSNRNARA
jgi:ElaB/YqjD/DUF883 family membrane-anchored ribosome-binding protein